MKLFTFALKDCLSPSLPEMPLFSPSSLGDTCTIEEAIHSTFFFTESQHYVVRVCRHQLDLSCSPVVGLCTSLRRGQD
jgi:hypothetical protein